MFIYPSRDHIKLYHSCPGCLYKKGSTSYALQSTEKFIAIIQLFIIQKSMLWKKT